MEDCRICPNLSYTNYSLLFKSLAANTSNDNANPNGALSIEEIPRDYKKFRTLLRYVGGAWFWHLRPKYKCETRALKKRLADKDSHLYLLKEFDKTIGYSFTINRPDLTKEFNAKTAEIENFGLAKPHTDKGYGGFYLQNIFQKLHEENFETAYLESRSTNHDRVIPFYTKQGMKVINIEHDIPEDIIVPRK